MRRSLWLALGLALCLGTSARAQSLTPSTANDTGPGFFGFMPKLFSSKAPAPDPHHFPIPNQTLSNFTTTDAFAPKLRAPIGQLNHAVTDIPTYSPLMPMSYLNAFHYRPPAPIHR